jgi:hypothetical protein
MTPKEKAEELIDKFIKVEGFDYDCEYIHKTMAKECALIAVDEIDKAIGWHPFEVPNKEIEYWQQVKQEIEKL